MAARRYPSLASLARDGLGWWLAGFFDGEGTFTLCLTAARGWRCAAMIATRADDIAVLHEIAERTGVGTVGLRHPAKAANPEAYWQIASRADCARLAAILARFPGHARKHAGQADLWALAVGIWADRDAPQREARLAALAAALSAAKAYDPAPAAQEISERFDAAQASR